MELDDQLAALAAGELDDDTARALRARAAADPAVARRLARHERLEALLTDWEAPAMSDGAIARLDAALDEALEDLGDEPLAGRAAPTGPLRAADGIEHDEPAGQTTPADGVVDLGAARARRETRRGMPAWVPAATVAAALLAVVGTGIVGGGLFSATDEATDDSMADAPMEDGEESDDGTATTGLAESEGSAAEDMADESMQAEMAEEAAPAFRATVDLQEGDLLALVQPPTAAVTAQDGDSGADDTASDDEGAQGDDGGADADAEAVDICVAEALERDTSAADERIVWRVASGTYADQEAVFVVIRTPDDDGDRYDVLAYDPADCSLLARDDTVR